MSTVKAEELGNAEVNRVAAVPLISEAAREKARLDRKRTKTGCLTCKNSSLSCSLFVY